MARINLLPWREEKRKQREKNFYIGLGVSVFAAAALVLAASMQIDAMINYQQSRNNYLSAEIKKVEKSITEIKDIQKQKKSLLERMKVIQKFQTNRSDSVRLLDEIVKVLPEGLHLTSYKQDNKKQNFNGVAQSNGRVSAFMRNIDRSNWLEKPDLNVIRAEGKTNNNRYKYSIFELTAAQVTTDIGEQN
jgi:type IV pilus assembly protein PilN